MINGIILRNFKCFEYLDLPLAPLTLLTGLNSSGKSSILQSLSLLHQTIVEGERSNELLLNGDFVSLGTAREVINEVVGARSFQIGIKSSHCECIWEFSVDNRDALSIPIHNISWKQANNHDEQEYWSLKEYDSDKLSGKMHHLLPEDLEDDDVAKSFMSLLHQLQYLSAERSGPRDVYPVGASFEHPNVGVNGQGTPWVLHQFAETTPMPQLIIETATKTLQRQVEAWMQEFFPGVGLEVIPVPRTNLVTLGIRMSEAESFHRPQNVGYGLTHVLPIVTAGLSGNESSVLLIENPEAHLHPRGQSLMGEFLARASACGMQVIVETHSDHVLNGARKAVKKQFVKHEQVAIHYFTPKEESRVISPLIDKNGNLDSWPEGFFDQFELDVSSLIGWNDQDDVSS